MVEFLSQQFGVPGINLDDFDVEPHVRALIPDHLCVTLSVFPVNVAEDFLIVATPDPSNLAALDDLRFLTGRRIEPVVTTELSLRRTFERYLTPAPALLN